MSDGGGGSGGGGKTGTAAAAAAAMYGDFRAAKEGAEEVSTPPKHAAARGGELGGGVLALWLSFDGWPRVSSGLIEQGRPAPDVCGEGGGGGAVDVVWNKVGGLARHNRVGSTGRSVG